MASKSRLISLFALSLVWGCGSDPADPAVSNVGGGGGVDGSTGGTAGVAPSVGGNAGATACAAPNISCLATPANVCVDPQTDIEHCGNCTTKCDATTELCQSGQCTCKSGLTYCADKDACANTMTDNVNCGPSCANCTKDGKTCSNGQCVGGGVGGSGQGGMGQGGAGRGGAGLGGGLQGGAPSYGGSGLGGGLQGGGPGFGGSGVGGGLQGGGPGFGGADQGGGPGLGGAEQGGGPGVGGDGVGGVTAGGPSTGDVDCTSLGGPRIAAADVVSDFQTSAPSGDDDEVSPFLVSYTVGDRTGTPWYGYSATEVPVLSHNTSEGACSPGGALEVTNSGNTDWGAGFGINFAPDVSEGDPDIKGEYDGSRYTGVGFYMKCSPEAKFAILKVPDGINDADIQTPECTYSDSSCNQYGIKHVFITEDWTYYRLYFDELIQDDDPSRFGNGIDASRLTAVQMQFNTIDDDGNKTPNPFHCWVDDVHFMTDPAPSTGTKINISSATSCTSGNKFVNCETGAEVRYRGVARPSFEWSLAGENITREDLTRIRAWKANTVRYGLRGDYWTTNEKKDVYQKIVKRAVKWALELGMNVILDLHLTNSDTISQKCDSSNGSVEFWSSVANQPEFKNDGRILFELCNEPHDISAGDWGTSMGSLYSAVRGAGANNVVLMGGLDWGYELDTIAGNIDASWTNVGYVTHPYVFKSKSRQDAYLGFAASHPVISTEFGDADVDGEVTDKDCGPGNQQIQTVVPEFEANGISWTAWAWNVDAVAGCGFPVLLENYRPTTNVLGTTIKGFLEQYGQ